MDSIHPVISTSSSGVRAERMKSSSLSSQQYGLRIGISDDDDGVLAKASFSSATSGADLSSPPANDSPEGFLPLISSAGVNNRAAALLSSREPQQSRPSSKNDGSKKKTT